MKSEWGHWNVCMPRMFMGRGQNKNHNHQICFVFCWFVYGHHTNKRHSDIDIFNAFLYNTNSSPENNANPKIICFSWICWKILLRRAYTMGEAHIWTLKANTNANADGTLFKSSNSFLSDCKIPLHKWVPREKLIAPEEIDDETETKSSI